MFEAYKVAVKVSLISDVSQHLAAMSAAFGRIGKDVDVLQSKLKSLKKVGLMSGIATGTGLAGLDFIKHTVKHASDYAHQLALMNQQGMKHAEIVQSINKAWATTKSVPTSSATENLATISHLRMVFGTTQNAIKYMPTVQKVEGILTAFRGKSGTDEAYSLAKALEIRGAVKTPADFVNQANMMTKAIVASGGKIGASDFQQTFKYGRLATYGWDDKFTYSILPTLIQEMKTRGGSGGGAGGPGNALMSLYSEIVGGTIPQKSLKTWQSIGLLDPSKVVWNKVGGAKGLEPGAIRGWQVYQSNPFQFAQQFLVPALTKAGYKTEKQQLGILAHLAPNRTAAFALAQFVTQAWKFTRDQKLIAQATGLSGYQQLLKTDPMMAQLALQKQWNSLMAILGYQIMPSLLSGATYLIDTFSKLGRWFSKNSAAAKVIMYSLLGFSGALTVLGGATLTIATIGIWRLNAAIIALNGTLAASGVAGGAATVAKGAAGAGLVALGGIGIAAGLFGYAGYKLYQTSKDIWNESAPGGAVDQATAAKYHPATQTQPITVQVDGRTLFQMILPHLNESMYHTSLQQSNSFMASMTPITNNTQVPYR